MVEDGSAYIITHVHDIVVSWSQTNWPHFHLLMSGSARLSIWLDLVPTSSTLVDSVLSGWSWDPRWQ